MGCSSTQEEKCQPARGASYRPTAQARHATPPRRRRAGKGQGGATRRGGVGRGRATALPGIPRAPPARPPAEVGSREHSRGAPAFGRPEGCAVGGLWGCEDARLPRTPPTVTVYPATPRWPSVSPPSRSRATLPAFLPLASLSGRSPPRPHVQPSAPAGPEFEESGGGDGCGAAETRILGRVECIVGPGDDADSS